MARLKSAEVKTQQLARNKLVKCTILWWINGAALNCSIYQNKRGHIYYLPKCGAINCSNLSLLGNIREIELTPLFVEYKRSTLRWLGENNATFGGPFGLLATSATSLPGDRLSRVQSIETANNHHCQSHLLKRLNNPELWSLSPPCSPNSLYPSHTAYFGFLP